MKPSRKMEGQTAFVCGASKGIGAAAAGFEGGAGESKGEGQGKTQAEGGGQEG